MLVRPVGVSLPGGVALSSWSFVDVDDEVTKGTSEVTAPA